MTIIPLTFTNQKNFANSESDLHSQKQNFIKSNSTTEETLEEKWEELENILFDEDEENKELYLSCDWFVFKKGTWREDVWCWFDKNHSKGVAYLMGLTK